MKGEQKKIPFSCPKEKVTGIKIYKKNFLRNMSFIKNKNKNKKSFLEL